MPAVSPTTVSDAPCGNAEVALEEETHKGIRLLTTERSREERARTAGAHSRCVSAPPSGSPPGVQDTIAKGAIHESPRRALAAEPPSVAPAPAPAASSAASASGSESQGPEASACPAATADDSMSVHQPAPPFPSQQGRRRRRAMKEAQTPGRPDAAMVAELGESSKVRFGNILVVLKQQPIFNLNWNTQPCAAAQQHR